MYHFKYCVGSSAPTERRTLGTSRFGFNAAISQLLTVPPYVVGSTSSFSALHFIFRLRYELLHTTLFRANFPRLGSHHDARTWNKAATVITWAIWSDRIQRRAGFVLAGQLLCLAGFAINVSAAPIGARYFGTFLIVSGGYAAYPSVTAW